MVSKIEPMEPILNNQTDADLLAGYAAGDESAFQEIVNRYKDGLYTFLKRFLNQRDMIDDVFQETFLQLFNSRDSFDRSMPLRPWLFTIAANKAKDAIRKRRRTATVPIGAIADSQEMTFEDVLSGLSAEDAVAHDDMERNETASLVRQIIADMPDSMREILIFAYFNKFSYKQMSQMLSIPIGTVKSRLHTSVGRFAKDWKAAMGKRK